VASTSEFNPTKPDRDQPQDAFAGAARCAERAAQCSNNSAKTSAPEATFPL
jgi:hypothetical protein